MLKLIIEDDENQVKVVRLLRDEITIGRKEGNTIRLTERNVSRKHARLIKKNDDIVLEDLGSYNGVKVNGVRISEPVEIDEGDKILIGDYTLMLKVEEKSDVDPFEEMATIPVERLDENQLEASRPAPAVSENTPTVQVAVKGLQAQAAVAPPSAPAPAPAPAAPQAPPSGMPAAPSRGNAIPQDKRAKIVVTTSNYAGTSFEMTQSPMVIGRNRENDIFIDHASLSAIHAQITFNGETYSIEDMGSKNGMLINNEEYSKMSLRKGDVIQLGHVRFRFVAPGEIYDFAMESQMEFGQSSNKKTIFIALGLVALFGIIFIFAFSGIFGSKKSSSPVDAPDLTQIYSRLDNLKSQKNWDEAVKFAKTSLDTKGLSVEQKARLQTRLQEMRDEKNHKQVIAEVNPLLTKSKWADAVTKALTIPKNSAYYNEAQAKVSTAKQGFLSNALAKSKVALTEKKCATINDFINKAASFNFTPQELSALTTMSSQCTTGGPTTVVNNGMNPVHRPTPMSTMSTEDMTPPDMSPEDDMHTTMRKPTMKDPDMKEPDMKEPDMKGSSGTALLAEGKSAYQNGNCSKAVNLLKKAYAKTGSGQALKYIGLCGCKSRHKSWARWAYTKMSGGQKRLIQKLCKKKGINL